MQEFLSKVGPELVDEIEPGITSQIEGEPVKDGTHSLPLPGYVEVAQRLRDRAADDLGRIEGLMSIVSASNHDSAHGIENAREKGHIGIAEVAGVLLQQRGNQELLKKYIGFAGSQIDTGMLPQPAPAPLVFRVFIL